MSFSIRVVVAFATVTCLATAAPVLAQCEVALLRANDGDLGDRFGYSVSTVSGDLLAVGAPNEDAAGNTSGAAYIYRREGMKWVEEIKLNAPDTADFDHFGNSLAAGDDFLVIGAWRDDDGETNTGSVYVFRRTETNWNLEVKLTASDGEFQDYFGTSVSVSGDYLVVGAPGFTASGVGLPPASGSAYVFHYDGINWVEEAKLDASDGAAGDAFGWSVAISGDLVVVGAPRDDDAQDDSGSAYIYRRNGRNWVEESKLTAADVGATKNDKFGVSVSISGDSALVGAYGVDDACVPQVDLCKGGYPVDASRYYPLWLPPTRSR